jgi:3-mercaptopyruvate sulfurtransferase SseA
MQSSLLYNVAVQIGCPHVSNYDGSWSEYSQRK